MLDRWRISGHGHADPAGQNLISDRCGRGWVELCLGDLEASHFGTCGVESLGFLDGSAGVNGAALQLQELTKRPESGTGGPRPWADSANGLQVRHGSFGFQ